MYTPKCIPQKVYPNNVCPKNAYPKKYTPKMPFTHSPELTAALQAMGENTLQALLAISHRLSTGDVPKHVASKAKSVFFDVGGYFMVSTGCQLKAFHHCFVAPLLAPNPLPLAPPPPKTVLAPAPPNCSYPPEVAAGFISAEARRYSDLGTVKRCYGLLWHGFFTILLMLV